MLSLLPFLLFSSLLFSSSPNLVVAQDLPSSAPSCARRCFSAKLEETDTLAPGAARDLARLCASESFVQAMATCLRQNCEPAAVTTGQALAAQVCNAAAASSDLASSASSTLASLSASVSSAVSSAREEASSVLATAATGRTLNPVASATESVASSLESVGRSLSRKEVRAASVTSAIASGISSVRASASASGSSSGAHKTGLDLPFVLVTAVTATLAGAAAVFF
ncbi:hypothetical protein JCM8547_005419 [Rhodosporidiobolus lusitaniae]